mmetsp:Transcript_34632/g.98132  ORF Transcript_34632/g.98132 Transcript_34632/m.98132 type:complete len:233 (-) Transcript_34632:772-1470(-)
MACALGGSTGSRLICALAEPRHPQRGYLAVARAGNTAATAGLRSHRNRAVAGESAIAMNSLANILGVKLPPRRRDSFLCTAAAAPGEKMTIAVTGATGLIGRRLVAKLSAQGHSIRVLTRNIPSAKAKLPFRGLSFASPADWEACIRGCDGVINLAGEPIATRWTPDLKREIMASRTNVTQRIVGAINKCQEDERPAVLVSASAVGFYGVSETQTFNEDSQSGADYLAEVPL